MSAPPGLLESILDDLGCGVDGADPAWLKRRVDGVWSRIEHYTCRKLHAPPAAYIDDWNGAVLNNPQQPMPWPYLPTRVSPFLRHFPVISVDAIESDGIAGDATKVRFDARSGKLFSLTGETYSEDLSGRLYMSRTRITYRTGWDEVPGDLYEVVLGCVAPLWNQRLASRAAGGTGLGNVSNITVVDVGSIEVGGTNFVDSAAGQTNGRADPLLGPWLNYLDLYIDHRSLVGDALNPTTVPASVASPPPTSGGTTVGAPVLMTARAVGNAPIPGTMAPLALEAPDYNLGGYWNHAAQTFTPPYGAYQFNASLACLSTNNNADVSLLLLRNGTEYARSTASATAANIMTATMALALVAEAGDTFSFAMVADRTDMVVLNPGSGVSIFGRSPP